LERSGTSPGMAQQPLEKTAHFSQSEAQAHIFQATQDRSHSLYV